LKSIIICLFIVLNLLVTACGGGGGASTEPETPSGSNTEESTGNDSSDYEIATTWYQPPLMATWQWQLTGTLNTDYDVLIYDIDLFDTDASDIAQLQAEGHKVICYFSAGSYESYRDDASQFDEADLGNTLDGWPDERWLDVRTENVKTIMQARLDLAQSKGCDGVEPDNVDGFQNNSGFDFTANDQAIYNQFLSEQAHNRGLAVGLKNDLDQVAELVDFFDFAVNEQCFQYDECDLLTPFIEQNKPVLNAEYQARYRNDEAARNTLCNQSVNLQFSTLILPLNLNDEFRYSCID